MAHSPDDERTLLADALDRQREEVVAVLDGLDDDEARARLVPSATTPLGLVKHLTFVERVWFHSRVAGVPRAALGLPDTVDESFVIDEEDTVASVRATYLAACERSREIVAGRDLDETYSSHHGETSLRAVHLHLLTELARHAGHGDILVELLRSQR